MNNIVVGCRYFSISRALNGKRNFRKFPLYGKRGTRSFKENVKNLEGFDYSRGARPTGVVVNGKHVEIKEMVPELIVPNLEGCKLKPYVSYKAPDVIQSEFTSLDLFNAVYSQKIIKDFETHQLSEDGSPKKPSAEERLTSEEALKNFRKTGSDIF